MLKSITLLLVVSLLGCTRAACPLTGDLVVPHEVDATKYVVCREGKELILSCDDGTAYNPLTKRCETSPRDRSERAPTCPYNQTETSYFPHETFCSMFYTCAYGVTNLEICPAGLEYNQDLWSCDWPSPNGCFAHTTSPPIIETTTIVTTKGTTEIIPETTTEDIYTTVTESIPETTTEDIYTTVTESIPETTTEDIYTTVTESIPETTTEITLETTTGSTPTDPLINCPLDETAVSYIPHPSRCDMFYLCWEGVPIMFECNFGYEFDIEEMWCVLISDSGCTASKTTPLIWSKSTEESSAVTEDPVSKALVDNKSARNALLRSLVRLQ